MIAVVDYGMGNLRSVERALAAVGGKARITNDHDALREAERIILPGVGAFGKAMERLRGLGLVDLLDELVREGGKPILGICLGMQLVCKDSREHGHHEGLGWIPATVRPLEPGSAKLRVPHIGWNEVTRTRESALFEKPGGTFYFVHSYHVDSADEDVVTATCDYGIRFAACLEQDNIAATQFHPEKSQDDGLELLRRFVEWQPSLAVA